MLTLADSLFQYNAWATVRLIEACRTLTPDQLGAQVPGVSGTIRDMLVHIVAAEHRYLGRLGARVRGDAVAEGAPVSWDVLAHEAAANGTRLGAIAMSAPAAVRFDESDGTFEGASVVLLIQVLAHSSEHRTHVTTTMGALGLGPVDLDERIDGWSWGETIGELRAISG